MTDPIYLDYQATTPLAPEVFEAMVPWLRDKFANPHSAHKLGREAAAAVEVARDQVAALMPSGGKVIFTGSATEAINLAFGAIQILKDGSRSKIIILESEHAAVRDTALAYQRSGFDVELFPVRSDGIVSLDALRSAIDERTVLVGAMIVNNEIGVVQPVEAIAEIAHDEGALMLCDAVQGFGRLVIPSNVDLVALSGHKIYGPKGIGALWVKQGILLPTLIHGGGQEQAVRSGTLSPALCVGLGTAAKIAAERMAQDREHIASLAVIALDAYSAWKINGSIEQRYDGNLNIRRDGLDVNRLMSEARGIAFSAGSACASGSGRPSHVLAALGLDTGQIKSSIRLGFGRYTTKEEIIAAAELINAATEDQMA